MKLRRFIIALSLLASVAMAQVSSRTAFYIRVTTVSGLAGITPSFSNPTPVAFVSDGSTSTDCTVGSGSNLVLCAYNGSVWAAAGGGGGGGVAFSAITGGTNTGAAMLVGSGASLGVTGTGTNQANRQPTGTSCSGPGFSVTSHTSTGFWYDTATDTFHICTVTADELRFDSSAGATFSVPVMLSGVAANTTQIAASGGSLTGSNASSFWSYAGTWNTSGNPDAFKIAITDTADGGLANLFAVYGGGSASTLLFRVLSDGEVRIPTNTVSAPKYSSTVLTRSGGFTFANGVSDTGVFEGDGRQSFDLAFGAGHASTAAYEFGNGAASEFYLNYPINGGINSDVSGTASTLYGMQSTGLGIPGDVCIGGYGYVGTTGNTAGSLQNNFCPHHVVAGLTNASFSDVVDFAVASGTVGGGDVSWCVQATDGTDFQMTCGETAVACVNKAGTFTTNSSVLGTAASAASSGTQTITFNVTNASGKCTLQIKSTSAVITPNSIQAIITVNSMGSKNSFTLK